jgi:hypothetical protein
MLRKLRKLPYKNSSQGAVLHEGEADLAPPRPTLSFTKQALTGVLLFVSVIPSDSFAEVRPKGNWIVCPKGSLQNAAGTTCTDKKTGRWVEPKRKHTEFKGGYPCPEMWKLKKNGNGCKKDHKAIREMRRLTR